MTQRLFHTERVARASSPSLALVVAPKRCARGHALAIAAVLQPALFRHGGYGAAELREYEVCGTCPTVRLARVAEVNPRGVT